MGGAGALKRVRGKTIGGAVEDDKRICQVCQQSYDSPPVIATGPGPRRGRDVLVMACCWQCLVDELRRRALAL